MSIIPTTDGTVSFAVGERTFTTWYVVVGDLKSKHRPVVMLHGGPGMDYIYMKPHNKLYTEAGIPIVYYNQLGLTQYPESPPEFWSMELFMDELDNLLTHLGIRDNSDMLGHSWGGVLGAEYASRRPHAGLKRLVLANTFASAELYRKGTAYWIDAMPDGLNEVIKKHKAEGTTSSEEYKAAMQRYNQMHICSLDPWPADLLASLRVVAKNKHPDFTMSNILRDWSVVPILTAVTAKTLLISSPKDEMWAPAVRPFFELIPACKWVDMQEGHVTHLPMYEAPEKYFELLLDFLKAT